MFLTLLQFAQDTKLHDTDMQEIATYLENHFSENITLDDLSHKFCLSKYHLVREYKKAIGFSPIDHLLKIRIEQAKMLLHSTDIPSYIIGQNVGFSTEANFIRMFKSKEGVTPGNYREMFK